MRAPLPLLPLLDDCLRVNQAHNFIYLNNPKVGCSTVKAAVWKAVAPDTFDPGKGVHDLARSPFENTVPDPHWIKDAYIFSFVRNPLSRVVSAYLNKIVGRKDTTWKWFAKTHGLKPDTQISFDQFVELISQDDPAKLNPHWRPQFLNICYPFITPDFIGRLENMDGQLPDVLGHIFGKAFDKQTRRKAHATAAQDTYQSFYETSQTRDRVEKIYEQDFAYFGYTPDPDAQAPAKGPITAPSGNHAHLMQIMTYRQMWRPKRKAAVLETHFSSLTDDPYKTWIDAEKTRVERMAFI